MLKIDFRHFKEYTSKEQLSAKDEGLFA